MRQDLYICVWYKGYDPIICVLSRGSVLCFLSNSCMANWWEFQKLFVICHGQMGWAWGQFVQRNKVKHSAGLEHVPCRIGAAFWLRACMPCWGQAAISHIFHLLFAFIFQVCLCRWDVVDVLPPLSLPWIFCPLLFVQLRTNCWADHSAQTC